VIILVLKMNKFYCSTCGKSLVKWERLNKRYCSDSCRQKAYRIRKERKGNYGVIEGIVSVTKGGDESD